jgi:hypothetical protein
MKKFAVLCSLFALALPAVFASLGAVPVASATSPCDCCEVCLCDDCPCVAAGCACDAGGPCACNGPCCEAGVCCDACETSAACCEAGKGCSADASCSR